MTFKMKGVSLFGNKGLRKDKKKAIKDEKEKIWKGSNKADKRKVKKAIKEIRTYTDY